ncbi:ABC transporter ATP-binding protein [Candidatus Soleaferrea massiliensis]|uniref:ABC transporter ATP-binding protein n=1 Tax=Candidatus Soleaferrea massiliensis TaxID=1470354 RepID=UPI0005911B0D|nr:ABC transporter ATP-binding protein [Candidatus Soleaferrea massiliensis]
MDTIIETVNLCRNYGTGSNLVQALKSVNIQIPAGSFTAIMGKSGSGKSTLLHLIGGLDRPSSGKVIVDGEDLYVLNQDKLADYRRRKIGLVFQSYNLIEELNAYDNIVFPILLDKKKPDRGYVEMLAEELGIKDRLSHLPHQLSGGQQQRVAIARALAHKPTVILADEPTGNLDQESGQEVLKLFLACHEKFGQTIVMVTHDPDIGALADQILNIEDGRIVGDAV